MTATNDAATKTPTRALATFISTSTSQPALLTPELRSKAKELLIDYIGVVVGGLATADSSEPIYAAVRAMQGTGNAGHCTVIGKGDAHMLPQYAALVNSAFGHSLDFDDTYAAGSLHAGVTAISAAMTQAEALGAEASTERFLVAMVVGYEVTCRLGRELGTDAYHRGFHNTGTAGIFGAVAAIAVLKRLSPDTIEAAFGLAGSKAAGSMQYLDNGSWNKRLHPGFAVHDAFLCVALAESGVVGASRIIEGEHGFLHAYSPASKDYLRLTAGLGSEWQFLQCSVKPFPSCRMTHTFIEMADNARQARAVRSADVSAIKLRLPPTNMLLIGDPTPNKIHPQNHIDAQFSVYFQVGNALLYGANTGITAYQRLQDPEIYSLSNITTVTGDPALRVFAGAMRIEWADGQVDEAEMHHPLGEVQHPYTRERVEEKYLSLVEPVFHGDRARDIIALVDDIETHHLSDLVALLR